MKSAWLLYDKLKSYQSTKGFIGLRKIFKEFEGKVKG